MSNNREVPGAAGRQLLEGADISALWNSTACRRVPKRRLVAALQKIRDVHRFGINIAAQ
jgi:hypothetical protein